MTLKHILGVLLLSAFFSGLPAYSADIDVDKMRDEQCTNHYKQIDYFLQYLYKVDGNLKDLNPSKIKRIEHLDGVFSDYQVATSQRKAAFGELYTDPDWWVYKLQKNARKLIVQLESMKKDSSWATYKKLAAQQVAGQIPANFFAPSATKTMEETVQLINNTSEFFTERTEIKERLEALGASSRLNRVFSDDTQQDAYESTLHRYLPSQLVNCQIDYLGRRLTKKP